MIDAYPGKSWFYFLMPVEYLLCSLSSGGRSDRTEYSLFAFSFLFFSFPFVPSEVWKSTSSRDLPFLMIYARFSLEFEPVTWKKKKKEKKKKMDGRNRFEYSIDHAFQTCAMYLACNAGPRPQPTTLRYCGMYKERGEGERLRTEQDVDVQR